MFESFEMMGQAGVFPVINPNSAFFFFLTRDRSSTKCPLRVHIAGHGSVTWVWYDLPPTKTAAAGWREERVLRLAPPLSPRLHGYARPPGPLGVLQSSQDYDIAHVLQRDFHILEITRNLRRLCPPFLVCLGWVLVPQALHALCKPK